MPRLAVLLTISSRNHLYREMASVGKRAADSEQADFCAT